MLKEEIEAIIGSIYVEGDYQDTRYEDENV